MFILHMHPSVIAIYYGISFQYIFLIYLSHYMEFGGKGQEVRMSMAQIWEP